MAAFQVRPQSDRLIAVVAVKRVGKPQLRHSPPGPLIVPRFDSWSGPAIVGQFAAGVTEVGGGVGVGETRSCAGCATAGGGRDGGGW